MSSMPNQNVLTKNELGFYVYYTEHASWIPRNTFHRHNSAERSPQARATHGECHLHHHRRGDISVMLHGCNELWQYLPNPTLLCRAYKMKSIIIYRTHSSLPDRRWCLTGSCKLFLLSYLPLSPSSSRQPWSCLSSRIFCGGKTLASLPVLAESRKKSWRSLRERLSLTLFKKPIFMQSQAFEVDNEWRRAWRSAELVKCFLSIDSKTRIRT